MIGELQPRSVLFITAQPPLILTHIILYRKCDLKKKKKKIFGNSFISKHFERTIFTTNSTCTIKCLSLLTERCPMIVASSIE